MRHAGNGRFEALLVHPPGSDRASDAVDLRVHAWDADGNRIEQITRDAFTLVDRTAAEAARQRGPFHHPSGGGSPLTVRWA